MTNSPNPDQEPQSRTRSRSRQIWLRASLGLGVVVLVGGVGAAWWAWVFIHERLSPLIEQNLSQTLNRPVELGDVESVSLTGVNFGAATLPPTATDRDQAKIKAVEVQFNLFELLVTRTLRLGITLVQPTVFIDQTQDGRWITTELQTQEREGFIRTELDVIRIQDGTVTLAPYQDLTAESGEPAGFRDTATEINVVFRGLTGAVNFRDRNRRISFDGITAPATGGELRLRGETLLTEDDERLTNLVVQGQNVLAPDVSSLLPLPLSLETGRLSGNLEVQFRPDEPLALFGTARFQNVNARIANVPNRFYQARGGLRFQEQLITLDDVRGRYGQIPAIANGTIHTQNGYNLSVQARSVTTANLLQTFDLTSPVPVSGTFDANVRLTGAIDEPLLTGTAQSRRTARIDRVDFSNIRTEFSLVPRTLDFTSITATPVQGGQITGSGRIAFGEPGRVVFNLQGQDLPGEAIARPYGFNTNNIRLGRIGADVRLAGTFGNFETTVNFRAPEATYPAQGEIVIANNVTRLNNATLQVAGGTVNATGRSTGGRWQASVRADRVALNRFSPDLRGLFSGDLRLSGSLNAFNPRNIQAEGQVRFSEGIAIVNRPITAAIAWNGQRLQVQRATAPGFSASGFLTADLEGANAPAITGLDLNVNLQDYDIAALPINVPAQVQLTGLTDFNGRVTGTPAAPIIAGRLGLNNLEVNQVAFEPTLTGDFRSGGQDGLILDVAGNRDQIRLSLDAQNRPRSFFIQRGEAIASGTLRQGVLVSEVRNFPLDILNLSPAAGVGLGELGGVLNGNFNINPNTYAVSGNVNVAQATLGYLRACSVVGQFRYVNGAIDFSDGIQVTFPYFEEEVGRAASEDNPEPCQSRYLIAGNFRPGVTPRFNINVDVQQGRIQDILTTLQLFEFRDFGRGLQTPTYDTAADVRTVPIQTFGQSLLNQLRRYSEIAVLLEQQRSRRAEASPFPDLTELRGNFTGTINLTSAPQTGLAIDFNLDGQNWAWREYGINEVIVEGNLDNGVLTFLPLRLQGFTYARDRQPSTEESFLSFTGQIGGENQSGQLLVQNLPIEAIRDLFRVPINLQGDFNANATLSGRFGNPQVVGELALANASLNGTQVQQARGLFGFDNARLTFSSNIVVSEPEPLRIAGSIPLNLDFLEVEPDSDQIALTVNVRNEGLALLNLLNRQVAWQGGEGEVSLTASGTLDEPILDGVALFNNATFTAQALPEPITDVNGRIQFNRTRIQVETLTGRFSDGQLTAQGSIPIFDTAAAPMSNGSLSTDPLLVTLSDLELNLKGIYDGGVDGEVVVTGTALAPVVGGSIALSNGRISLPDTAQNTVVETPIAEEGDTTAPPRFADLQLTLGDRILITRQPILNFVASGDLTINGTLDALRPQGTIRLRSGQVNLFTTQFSLARGYDSNAQFFPNRGLDPILDVRLSTSVLEVTRTPIQTAAPYAASEVAETPVTDFGALQTVRIQASVVGPASELFDSLTLSSSPSRSQNEIIALLGGGFIDTLGRGDSTLAIANLAGSALLTSVQNLISNALGLSDFRLFPTTITSEDGSGSTFGLAAELGVDITQDISVSALQVLTSQQPTQFNIRYRLSDEFLLRGSTNLSGDSRAVIEFQTRF